MTFLKTFDRRTAGLIIFAGFITLAFATQGSAVPNAPAGASDALIASGRAPMDQDAARVSLTAADSVCEKQNWPYYSEECLRGEGGGSAPASSSPTTGCCRAGEADTYPRLYKHRRAQAN